MQGEQPKSPAPKKPRSTKTNHLVPPRWLGVITYGTQCVWAREQMAALTIACHSPQRCGIRFPASVLGPHLVRQLWDACVVSCLRAFAVEIWVGSKEPREERRLCIVKVRVSPLLLGITSIECVEPPEELWVRSMFSDQYWIDENRMFMDKGVLEVIGCMLVDTRTGKERHLIQEDPHIPELCVNGEWWLQLTEKNGAPYLVITSLTAEKENDPVLVPLPDDYHLAVETIRFNKVMSSQAVILLNRRSSTTQLVIFDVTKTHATKNLEVESITECVFPPEHLEDFLMESLLVMKNRAGQNVFIVETSYDGSYPPGLVFAVQSNGCLTKLYDEVGTGVVSQLSSTQFSIYYPRLKELQIFDCNDITTSNPRPLQTIPHVEHSEYLSGGGFIVLVSGKQRLQVIEASSGLIVACIGFLAPGWSIKQLNQTESFMW